MQQNQHLNPMASQPTENPPSSHICEQNVFIPFIFSRKSFLDCSENALVCQKRAKKGLLFLGLLSFSSHQGLKLSNYSRAPLCRAHRVVSALLFYSISRSGAFFDTKTSKCIIRLSPLYIFKALWELCTSRVFTLHDLTHLGDFYVFL